MLLFFGGKWRKRGRGVVPTLALREWKAGRVRLGGVVGREGGEEVRR